MYYGIWGSRLFQSIYETAPGWAGAVPAMPEWYLVIFGLGLLTLLGGVFPPLLYVLPFLVLAVGALVLQAVLNVAEPPAASRPGEGYGPWLRRTATAGLYLIQPLARLLGRLRHGLTPWRRRQRHGFTLPRQRVVSLWSERWQAPERWLRQVVVALEQQKAIQCCGGAYDRWDLEVWGGVFGSTRLLMAVEEHGEGRQMVRLRLWPRYLRLGIALLLLTAALAGLLLSVETWLPAALFAVIGAAVAVRLVGDAAAAQAAVLTAISHLPGARDEGR